MAAYIKFGSSIKGNSVDDKHKDWCDVLSWSWGCSNDSGGAFGSARTEGRSSTQDVAIVKLVDNASRDLMKACQSGGAIDEVNFEACKQFKTANGQGEINSYYTLKLKDCVITSISPSGSGDDSGGHEQVTLRAREIEYDHIPTKPDGTRGEGSPVGYDNEANKVL